MVLLIFLLIIKCFVKLEGLGDLLILLLIGVGLANIVTEPGMVNVWTGDGMTRIQLVRNSEKNILVIKILHGEQSIATER